MSLEMMTEAVKLINGRAITEASGDVNIDRLRDVARLWRRYYFGRGTDPHD